MYTHNLFFKYDLELAEEAESDPAIIEIGFLLYFIAEKLSEVVEHDAYEWQD